MLPSLGLNADNFYKFLTTLSLIVCVYCLSFPELFIKSFNDSNVDRKKQQIELIAERGFIDAQRHDIVQRIDTSGRQFHIYSIVRRSHKRNEVLPADTAYYYQSRLSDDSLTRALLDSLNRLSYRRLQANAIFELYGVHIVNENNNNNIREGIYWVLGGIAFITFIFGMIKWSKLKDNDSTTPLLERRIGYLPRPPRRQRK